MPEKGEEERGEERERIQKQQEKLRKTVKKQDALQREMTNRYV